MKIPIYQIDAFTNNVFSGNPAAVCLLDSWLDDELMLNIAAENNLPETAFIVKEKEKYQIRWFSPKVEIDLCGHATLASAFVLFGKKIARSNSLTFDSQSGPLTVEKKDGGLLSMTFPSRQAKPCSKPDVLEKALGTKVLSTYASRDILAVLEDEDQIRNLRPDFELLSSIKDYFAVIVTAEGTNVDFVSRFFAPNIGIQEDPVTGSSHCTLIPYWAEQLKKNKLHALQLSARGGELFCENKNDKVIMSGNAAMYLEGEIQVSL